MTTTELNAELYRQLSYIAHDEGFLQKTLDFVKGLTKSKNASGTKGIVYTRMLERLSDYQEYKKGWDGEDAAPLNTIVVRNFKKVLLKAKEEYLDAWDIFPAANGSLLLQNKEKKCGINLGKSSFSYYTTKDGKVEGMNNIKFTPTALIKTLEGLSA